MIGYQMTEDSDLISRIIANRESIYEVYFSWGDIPNGRNSQLRQSDLTPWEAQTRQIDDLRLLTSSGIRLNLLLNGNCYGRDSQSRKFFSEIGDTICYLDENFSLDSITTTSPLIAKFVKANFPQLRTRASVNMRIGTTEGMDYLSEYFDGYYMQREYNRDFERIKLLKNWCDANGKELFMLANSGCLNFCSAQTFHDNLVAHESEISAMDNAYQFTGICREYLSREENHKSLIDNTNFVRPEDIALYDEYFTAAKLATRVSRNPVGIMNSYIRGRYVGNILDILEPAHSIYPYVLENGEPMRIVKIDTEVAMFENEEIKDKHIPQTRTPRS